MDYRRFGSTIILRIDRGEEIVSSIVRICEKEKILCACVEGIGACDKVVMGLYDVSSQKFNETVLEQPVEVTSLLGNITEMDGSVYQHLHIGAADAEGHAYGGHLKSAWVSGTAEVFIRVLETAGAHVRKKKDDFSGTGLNVLDFDGVRTPAQAGRGFWNGQDQ